MAGENRHHKTQDRVTRKALGEVYVQRWTAKGQEPFFNIRLLVIDNKFHQVGVLENQVTFLSKIISNTRQ